jgi:hypothetical protein
VYKENGDLSVLCSSELGFLRNGIEQAEVAREQVTMTTEEQATPVEISSSLRSPTPLDDILEVSDTYTYLHAHYRTNRHTDTHKHTRLRHFLF